MGKLAVFADAQTGQLDKANDRGDTAIAIQDACAAQQAKLLKALEPPTLAERVRGLWPF